MMHQCSLSSLGFIRRLRDALLGKARIWLLVFLAKSLLTLADVRSDASTESLLVIVSSNSPINHLSPNDLADLFLGRGDLRTGWRKDLKPLDQKDPALRERFYQNVAAMSLNRLRAYWAKRVFTGRGRPPEELSIEEAGQAVLSDPSIITYLPAGQCPQGAKALYTIP
jgi:hypothetical protein